MNSRDGKYKQYVLIREMLEFKNVLAAMAPLEIFEFAAHIRHEKILLTGEGSSRIFPAQKVICDVRHHDYKKSIITEGASQAGEYDLSDYTVFIASNSGRTKESYSKFLTRGKLSSNILVPYSSVSVKKNKKMRWGKWFRCYI